MAGVDAHSGLRPMAAARPGSSARPIQIQSWFPAWRLPFMADPQPDNLRGLLTDGDDGLLPRILWVWPEPEPFRLGHQPTRAAWAIRALDRLRELDLQSGDPALPIRVPLDIEARPQIESLARDMQQCQPDAAPLLAAAFGKARGQALRLALVLELLWWCGEDSASHRHLHQCSRAVGRSILDGCRRARWGAEVAGRRAPNPACGAGVCRGRLRRQSNQGGYLLLLPFVARAESQP